jgi:hypothetical protein
VIILPTHHNLQDVVQLEQRGMARHLNAPPDRWVGVIQGDFDLENWVRWIRHIDYSSYKMLIGEGLSHTTLTSRGSKVVIVLAITGTSAHVRQVYQEHIFEIPESTAFTEDAVQVLLQASDSHDGDEGFQIAVALLRTSCWNRDKTILY